MYIYIYIQQYVIIWHCVNKIPWNIIAMYCITYHTKWHCQCLTICKLILKSNIRLQAWCILNPQALGRLFYENVWHTGHGYTICTIPHRSGNIYRYAIMPWNHHWSKRQLYIANSHAFNIIAHLWDEPSGRKKSSSEWTSNVESWCCLLAWTNFRTINRWISDLNSLRPRQMNAISQTTFSNTFSWMKMF